MRSLLPNCLVIILKICVLLPGVTDDDGGEGDVELEHVGERPVHKSKQNYIASLTKKIFGKIAKI